MSNWMYSIGFSLTDVSKISAAEQAVERLDGAVESLDSSAARAGQSFGNMADRGDKGFKRMIAGAGRLLAKLAIVSSTVSSINLAAQNDATNIAIDFATGGDGARNVEFVESISNRLGTNLQAGREGFKQLSGALQGTNLQGQATRDIFEGIATAGGAMRLSADQVQGAYLAVAQIASKGKVQAEELRGQLGERIPGAFRIAAEAMNVTQSELNKMLETGKVTSDEFLPRFAAQLTQTFGGAAAEVADRPAASMERFTGSVYQLQVAVGEQLLPVVANLLDNYLIPMVQWVGEHIELFSFLATVVGGAWVATKAYTISLGVYRSVAAFATAAQVGFNVALTANPIGIVVTALGALVAGVTWAYGKVEWFKNMIDGLWSALKTVGSFLYKVFVSPFESAASIVSNAAGSIESDLEGVRQSSVRAHENLGRDNANAYSETFYKTRQSWNQRMSSINKQIFDPAGFARDTLPNGIINPQFLQEESPEESPAFSPTQNTTRAGLAGVIGGKEKTINISLEGLVNELTIVANNVTEGVDQLEEIVTAKLLQVLNTANQVQ
ncbi:MAG: tape measure protein [Bacteroidota bacterium]